MCLAIELIFYCSFLLTNELSGTWLAETSIQFFSKKKLGKTSQNLYTNFFWGFLKFNEISNFCYSEHPKTFPGVMLVPTKKFGPDRFDVYWIQKNNHPDKQSINVEDA